MMDRGMMKWEPFDSVESHYKIMADVLSEKNKIKKPELSEDQLRENEKKIFECYTTSSTIKIVYYENGYKNVISDKIKKIDLNNKKIHLLSKTIYFNQILKIN